MELRAQIGKYAEPPAKVLRHHTGFQRTQADSQIGHGLTDFFNQQRQLRFPRLILSPARNLNAREHDFPIAPNGQLLCLSHRHLQRSRADRPTGVGNDAVGAEIHAPVLNLQHGTGSLLQAAGRQTLEFPTTQCVVQLLLMTLFSGGIQEHFHKGLPLAAAADDIDAQSPDGLRVVLGIAAAHGDHRLGIVPAAPADHRPILLVRHGGDRAGIDDVAVTGFLKAADFVTLFQEKVLHGLGLILICLAAEGIKRKFHLSKPPIFPLASCVNHPKRQLLFCKKAL